MKALIYTGDRQLELKECIRPEVLPGRVLVKVSKAAICGTDLHKFCQAKSSIEKIDGMIPIAGHEPSGWISEIGAGVTDLKIGQRILVAGVFSCGTCHHCKSGFNTACIKSVSGLHWNNHGCNSEYISVPAANVLELPDSISFDKATMLTCAGGTAMTIVEETGFRGDQKLVILGLGPVGMALLIIAKSMGALVAGVEPSAYRRELALRFGIDFAINPNTKEPVHEIRRWSNGLGCELVAECVGKSKTQLQGIEMAANKGKIAIAGLGNEEVSSSVFQRIIGSGGLQLIGIAATPIKYMIKLIKLTVEKNLPFDQMITHHFTLNHAKEALLLMESGNCGKIIFDIAEDF